MHGSNPVRVSLPTAPSQECARTRAYLLEGFLRVLRIDDLHVGDRDPIRPHGSGGKRQATPSDHKGVSTPTRPRTEQGSPWLPV